MVNDMKTKSIHAQVAAQIRKELKQFKLNVKPTIKSEIFAGGSAVTIHLTDTDPTITAKVRELCAKYEYGEFNTELEYYDYSNVKSDLPQVKYVTIEVTYTQELRQTVYEFLIKNHRIVKTCELFKDIPYYDDTVDIVYKYMNGTRKGYWE